MGRNVCSLSMTGMQALCQCKRSLLISAYVWQFAYFVHSLYFLRFRFCCLCICSFIVSLFSPNAYCSGIIDYSARIVLPLSTHFLTDVGVVANQPVNIMYAIFLATVLALMLLPYDNDLGSSLLYIFSPCRLCFIQA